jgi:hypothetical protein
VPTVPPQPFGVEMVVKLKNKESVVAVAFAHTPAIETFVLALPMLAPPAHYPTATPVVFVLLVPAMLIALPMMDLQELPGRIPSVTQLPEFA